MGNIGKDLFAELAGNVRDTLIQTEQVLTGVGKYHRVIHGALYLNYFNLKTKRNIHERQN